MLYVFAVVLSIQISFVSIASSAESCHIVVANSAASDPTLFRDIKKFLENSGISEIYKGTRPNWNHYNETQILIQRLEKIKLTNEEKEALKNLVTKEIN